MTSKPILFSAPMVRAILEGRKTQTRRVQKIEWKPGVNPNFSQLRALPYGAGTFMIRGSEEASYSFRPRFAPGDELWVREAVALVGNVDPPLVLYRADGYEAECRRHGFDNPPPESEVKWKPSIHMPRWASRITLRVTAVKVERLQDISEEDAKAEGVADYVPDTPGHCIQQGPSWYRGGFKALWASINGPSSWEANPWVAAISFERVH